MSRMAQGWTAMPAAEDASAPTSRATRATQSAGTSNTSYAVPKTRQRIHKPPEPLAVPDIEEDAAERKRVLNVLAQRRYRERRRQKKARAGTAQQASGAGAEVSATVLSDAQAVEIAEIDSGFERSLDVDANIDPSLEEAIPFVDIAGEPVISDMGVPTTLSDLDLTSNSMALESFEFDLSLSTSLATMAAAKAAATGSWDLGTSNGIVATSGPSPPSPSTGINPLLLRGSNSSSRGYLSSNNSMAMSTSSRSYSSPSNSSATDHLSPDSYFLPVTELTLLRAVMRISARLGCTEAMWQIDGQSPFHIGSQKKDKNCNNGSDADDEHSDTELAAQNHARNEANLALLPPNWRPTHAQRYMPHHPALDILPWPSVREKLIGLFNLPLHERPPIAADPLALVHLIYDLEDSAEGLRIWGSDPYDPTCWEVGQLVFERWWFIFDREIIEQSNRWRDLRGAARLRAVSTDTRTKGVMDMIWA
ncbi:hypothetical protein SEUCBS139899_005182 [Sporothrix eucalyptigena]|uniref:BZIP domain-containing protein n=1 Tax=Sporothrix eucalyptigena TaxID=1812306 RepID=A0ABP0AJZ5_9PEZI